MAKVPMWKKILIVVAILGSLGLITWLFFIDDIVEPVVKERITKTVTKKSNGLYKLRTGDLDISLWDRSITFSDLHIGIDSAEYHRLRKEKRIPPTTFEVFIPSGVMRDIDLSSWLFQKEIIVGQLDAQQARVRLYRHGRIQKDKEDDPLWKQLPQGIRSIQLALATCQDLNISYIDVDNPSRNNWQLEHCDARFSDIRIDSAAKKETDRLMFAKDVAIHARNLNFKTRNGLYKLHAGGVQFSSANRNALIKEFRLQPAVKDEEIIRHYGYQHEIYRVDVPVINLKDLQWQEWVANDILKIETIELRSPAINVYLDRNARPNPYSKRGQYPQQLLQKAPFGIDVRKLTVADCAVVYREKNSRNQLSGNLHFTNVRGYIDNITNTAGGLNRSSTCVVSVNSNLMNSGQLHTIFRFNLRDKSGAFNVKAAINNIEADQLQPLAKAMASVDVQTFNLDKLNYSIAGNENAATGNLQMKYDNLDVLIYRVQRGGEMNDKGLLSFFANRFGVYKSNPMNGKTERKAMLTRVQRDPTKSFFALIWKTLSVSASEIILRPRAQRMVERNQERLRQQSVVIDADNK